MITILVGEEDDCYAEVIGERNLHLAVLTSAIADLSAEGYLRVKAVSWFEGAPARITFDEVQSMFNLKESRLNNILNRMIFPRKTPKFRIRHRKNRT